MREVVNSLMRRDLHVLDEGMAPYYQDVYDHVLRATEWTESLRDLVTHDPRDEPHDPRQPHEPRDEEGHELGGDHRGPTAITGFYGQNVPYPGFATHWGFWFSTALIIVLSGGLYLGFRRRDWL